MIQMTCLVAPIVDLTVVSNVPNEVMSVAGLSRRLE